MTLCGLKQNIDQCQITNNTPYLALSGKYGVYFVTIQYKIYCVITP